MGECRQIGRSPPPISRWSASVRAARRQLAPARDPSAKGVALLPERRLIGLALRRVDVRPVSLARALNIAPDVLEHARRHPTTLPLPARLTLAALVGRHSTEAAIARELRRRTLSALAHHAPPIPSRRAATSATALPEVRRP